MPHPFLLKLKGEQVRHKKRKQFFSEEKNQKTFAPAQACRSGTWPDSEQAEK
jgi:hypothetical protein